MLCVLLLNLAFAIPQQLTQQGRLIDGVGIPIDGEHVLTFQVYDNAIAGNSLWGESLTVTFNNGYYSVVLGSDSGNPLTADIWEASSIYLSIQVDNDAPLQPRRRILSNPYALKAEVATNVDGGTINATEISINGDVVLDSSGSFIGQSTPEWSSIQNIPSDFSDGVDNDSLANVSCPSDDMILSYTGGSWICGYDDVLDSADIISIVEGESEIALNLSSTSTVNGEVIQTGTEQDTLGSLNCSNGQIPVYDLSENSWICGADNDATLSESDVKSIITQAVSLNLDVSTTVNGATILTSDSTLELDWNNINNRPSGLDDGDDNDSLDALNCSDGEIAIKQSGVWTCIEFSTLLDADGDGSLQWSDCDDNDATKGDSSNDGDCDGVVTSADCDDSDAANINTNVGDVDCDGVATSIDCDDSNANITTGGTGDSETCAAASCKEILDNGFSSGDGTYWLNPSGASAFEATCDMSTDGGGWTLILNYLHTGGTNPSLVARSISPLQGSSSLGTNESSSTSNWGHASNTLMNSFSISELMFYCKTSNHGRVIHFKTNASDVISYVQSGSGSMAGVYDSSLTSSMPLRNSSTLPLHTDGENSSYANQGDNAMTEFPFYSNSGIGNPRAHWGIRGGTTRWECDDHTDNANSHTLHRVWLR